MKKILSLIITLSVATATMADMKWGFEAGYDHNWLSSQTTLNISKDGATTSETRKAVTNLDGFHAGLTFSYLIGKVSGMFVGAGVNYQYATGKVNKDNIAAVTFDIHGKLIELESCNSLKYTMHNLQVPLRVGYEYKFDNGVGIFGYVGPTFNIALDWQLKGTFTNLTGSASTVTLHQISGRYAIQTGDNVSSVSDDDFKHYGVFDIALSVGIGVSYNIFYTSIGVDAGLLNICKHPSYTFNFDNTSYDTDNRAHNTQLKIAVGLRF